MNITYIKTKKILTLILLIYNFQYAQIARIKYKTPNPSTSWQGCYYGLLPCADCDGIETFLTLLRGNQYILRTSYIHNDSKPETIKGKFTWKGNRIKLSGIKEGTRPTVYLFSQNHLTQMDLKGNEIKSKFSKMYVLNKANNKDIENKRWELFELFGTPISGNAQTHYLIFHSRNGILEAKTGCNQINNHYRIKNGTELSVSQGISTLMACPDQNIEDDFKEMLIHSNQLMVLKDELIFSKEQSTLAKFKLIIEHDFHRVIGKTFIQENSQNIDPKLGGISFITFESVENASIKIGDIINVAKVSYQKDKLILEEILTGRIHSFTMINNDYLEDENGTRWQLK